MRLFPEYVSSWSTVISNQQYSRDVSPQIQQELHDTKLAAIYRWPFYEQMITLTGIGSAALNAAAAYTQATAGSIPITTPVLGVAAIATLCAVRGTRDGTIADILQSIDKKVLEKQAPAALPQTR